MAHYNNKRNNANTSNINVRDLPSSGFDLSYKSKDSGAIGFRKLVGYEYCMSGDKMRINTAADLQFQPTNAPMLPAMDMRIEHTFIPFRNVNMDYEDTLSFDKGVAWETSDYPHCSLVDLVDIFQLVAMQDIPMADNLFAQNISTIVTNPEVESFVEWWIDPLLTNLERESARYYVDDFWYDFRAHALRVESGWPNMTPLAKTEVVARITYDMYRYFFGEGSALDVLNAPILHYKDYRNMIEWQSIGQAAILCVENYQMPIAVMPLRALYADWFETTRDSNLEPARKLPRYHKLGNSLEDYHQIVFCYLTPRYALIGKDLFTTANIDSPYRHVIAPIANNEEVPRVADVALGMNQYGNEQTAYRTYFNSEEPDGLSIINTNFGTLRKFMQTQEMPILGLDLVALKRAKQAKDWLMRGHVYGDEYQDYVLAQYGVKIEDARINKPLYLGGYSKEVDINTTVNPTATNEMPAGAKNTTMTSGGTTDSFDFYTSEHGIVLTWLYLVPAVTYEPYEIRNTIMQPLDWPTPVYSNDSEEMSVYGEMSRTATYETWLSPFGRHPYAHAWRSRVDENHGQFLTEYKPYTFLRDFRDVNGDPLVQNLNYAFIHAHVNLDFMVDTDSFNPIWFGTISHNNYVVRKLPVVTDEC